MNLDAMGMLVITTVATIVQAIFWRWVSSVSDSSKDNAQRLDDAKEELARFKLEVASDYQKKSDAHIDNERIMKGLDDIKTDVKELSHKLDRKMDK